MSAKLRLSAQISPACMGMVSSHTSCGTNFNTVRYVVQLCAVVAAACQCEANLQQQKKRPAFGSYLTYVSQCRTKHRTKPHVTYIFPWFRAAGSGPLTYLPPAAAAGRGNTSALTNRHQRHQRYISGEGAKATERTKGTGDADVRMSEEQILDAPATDLRSIFPCVSSGVLAPDEPKRANRTPPTQHPPTHPPT